MFTGSCVALQASVQPSTHAAAGDQSIASVSVVMGDGNQAKKNKVPRRILHFSDGILEEYSTDEDEDESDKAPLQPVDPVSHRMMFLCMGLTLSVCFRFFYIFYSV